MAIYCGLVISNTVVFLNISVGLFSERWFQNRENPEEYIGMRNAIVWLIAGFVNPIFGLAIDKLKNRGIFVLIFIKFTV